MARSTNSNRSNGDTSNDTNSEDTGDQAAPTARWHVIVSDSGNTLNEFPNAQGVYSDDEQKEWTTTVIDTDRESYSFYTGRVVYAAPNTADHPAPSVEKLKEHHAGVGGENRWGREY